MISYFGDFAEDDTVLIPFNTFDSNDPAASVTVTTLIASDIYVHKDGSTTDIVTDGASIAVDFDSVTGNHLVTIDTSAHADYSTGSEYAVRIEGATVDGGNINAWIGAFSIERAGGVLALLKATTLASIKAETALIVADTNELQTDDVPGLIAALDTVVDRVETDTQDLQTQIGTAGAGLTAVPWNASWDVEVQSECADALTAFDPATATNLATVAGYLDTEIAAILADTNELQTDWANGGRLDNLLDGAASAGDPWTTALPGAYGVGTAGKIIGDNIDAPISTVDTVVDGIQTDLSNGTDGLGAIKADTAAILVDTADMQPKLGTPAADVSADIAAVKAETALIVADTNELQTDDVPGLIAALNDLAASDILTTALTESYNADGSAPTLTQALCVIMQMLTEKTVAGTTTTIKQLDGSTTAFTLTLDDGASPTSITRAT